MIECPACAGPPEARATCATCNGVMEVTQEVFDSFVAQQEKTNRFSSFVQEAEDALRGGIDSEIVITINDQTLEYTPQAS